MANKNFGIILLSGVLTLGTAAFAFPQSQTQGNTTTTQDQSNTSKSTTKGTKGKTTQSGSQKLNTNKNGAVTNGTGANKGSQSQLQSKDDIQQVQAALQQKGLDPGPIDGVMGPKTQKAIAAFQRQQSLSASGKLDAQTQSALGINVNEGSGINSAEPGREKPGDMTPSKNVPDPNLNQTPDQQLQPYQNPQVPGAVTPDIGRNSTGTNMGIGTASSVEDVRQAQMALKNRGFDPGEINGMLSSDTQDAIRKFQSANNLPVTGNLDDKTQGALGVTIKGTTNPDTFHNEGRTKPPQDNDDVAAMGPSAQAEADPPVAHKHMNDDADANGKTIHEYRERASKAGEVLDSLTAVGDNRIPDSILRRAEAIAVIPNMIKGAFGLGGRYGKGLVVERTADGRWGAPAYINIGGGSFGAQLGVSSTDLVLVFTDREAVKSLEKGMSLKLGVDAGVSAGPIGRSAEAGVSQNVQGGIFAYSRAKGLFAGIALDGAVLDMDKTANRKVYGANVNMDTLMTSTKLAANANVRPFMKSLEAAVPMKRPTR